VVQTCRHERDRANHMQRLICGAAMSMPEGHITAHSGSTSVPAPLPSHLLSRSRCRISSAFLRWILMQISRVSEWIEGSLHPWLIGHGCISSTSLHLHTILLPIRFLQVYKPKTSDDVLRFLEPALFPVLYRRWGLEHTDMPQVEPRTRCADLHRAHNITFDTLSFDQVRHILAIHWPASTLLLVATGILWETCRTNTRLAMRSCCIAMVSAISG